MSDAHSRRVEQAFTAQAAAFEDPRFNRVFTADAQWVFADLTLSADDLLLDVAAGTGHAARQLAPSVRAVVALDATEAMLATGKARADGAGLRNIVFVRGDAAALPFIDGSFDVVVSRFAVHHFAEPDGPLAEMVRCLRVGGRIAVADLVSDERPEVARRQNELERLRDRSHTRVLTAEELSQGLAGAGVGSLTTGRRARERPLAPWLSQTETSPAAAGEIVGALEDELAGGPATGFSPRLVDGELHFTQRFAAVVGVRLG